jgi:hypothetical protein
VSVRAHQTIVRLHEKVGELQSILPDAARVIQTVLAEAGLARTAEACAA